MAVGNLEEDREGGRVGREDERLVRDEGGVGD